MVARKQWKLLSNLKNVTICPTCMSGSWEIDELTKWRKSSVKMEIMATKTDKVGDNKQKIT
jgi:hypothetical protein